MIIKKGLIINSTRYKDYDCIINVLFEDEVNSILLRGVYRNNNKNLIFTSKLIYGEFEIYEGKTNGYKLKSGKIIDNFSFENDYYKEVALNIIDELLIKCLIDIDFKKVLLITLKVLNGLKNKNTRLCLIYYILNLSSILGISLNLNSCVECNLKDDLVALSFNKGGVVCKNHKDENDMDVSLSDIEMLKELNDSGNYGKLMLKDDEFLMKLTFNLLIFVENFLSININSKSLIF